MNRAMNSEGRKSNGWTERASQSVPGVTYVVPEPEPEEAGIWFFTRCGGVSDPQQLIPLLKDLSTDERVPLITRNTAGKILKKVESAKKKEQ